MKLSEAWEPHHLEFLRKPANAAEFILAYLEDGEPLNECLGDVIKAQGLAKMARLTGIAAPNLLRATRKGANPTVATLSAILDALGMELSVAPKNRAKRRSRAKPRVPEAKAA